MKHKKVGRINRKVIQSIIKPIRQISLWWIFFLFSFSHHFLYNVFIYLWFCCITISIPILNFLLFATAIVKPLYRTPTDNQSLNELTPMEWDTHIRKKCQLFQFLMKASLVIQKNKQNESQRKKKWTKITQNWIVSWSVF